LPQKRKMVERGNDSVTETSNEEVFPRWIQKNESQGRFSGFRAERGNPMRARKRSAHDENKGKETPFCFVFTRNYVSLSQRTAKPLSDIRLHFVCVFFFVSPESTNSSRLLAPDNFLFSFFLHTNRTTLSSHVVSQTQHFQS